jgi:hypothetical protein
VDEVADLVAGAGLLIFVLAPPVLALAAVAIVVVLIPLLIGAILAAPVLLLRRWWHSRDHTVVPGTRGDHEGFGFVASSRAGRAGSQHAGPKR